MRTKAFATLSASLLVVGCGGTVTAVDNGDATVDVGADGGYDVQIDAAACGDALNVLAAEEVLDQAVGACLGTPYWCGTAIADVDASGRVTKYWLNPTPTADEQACLDHVLIGLPVYCGRGQNLSVKRCMK